MKTDDFKSNDIEIACRCFGTNMMKAEMYNTIFDAVAKEKGINRDKELFEISSRELQEWIDNKIREFDGE